MNKQRFLPAVALLLLASPALHAQTAAPTFAVASIRLNNNSTDGRHHIYNDPANAEFRTVNVSALALLNFAFDIPVTQILEAPAFARTAMWDVTAKSDPALDAELSKLPTAESRAIKRKMVQGLLTDRFNLKAHLETRELPEYALVVVKTGARVSQSKANGHTYNRGRDYIDDQGISISDMAQQIAQILDQPVVDQTALPGRYDLKLRWTPDDLQQAAAPDAPPAFFTALQEQLGLKLESQKGPVQVLVIDQLTPPTDN